MVYAEFRLQHSFTVTHTVQALLLARADHTPSLLTTVTSLDFHAAGVDSDAIAIESFHIESVWSLSLSWSPFSSLSS